MSKLGEIEAALQKALSTAQGKKEKRQAYLKRLQEGAQELGSDEWDGLSTEAQLWVNEATKAANDDKELPDFDQATDETSEDKGKADSSTSKPKEGDEVATSTKKSGGKKKAAAPKADKKADKKPAEKKSASTKGGRGVKGDGYKGHRAGSNKETVHKVFDEKGAEAAIKKAVSQGIKEASARSWISSWGGGKKKAK